MNVIDKIEKMQCKQDIPDFNIGDTVKVYNKIRETFTVRRVSFGVGVEKIFPLHTPRIDRIEVERRGHVRRAKLYYLRDKVGKAAKVKEKKFNAYLRPADMTKKNTAVKSSSPEDFVVRHLYPRLRNCKVGRGVFFCRRRR